jgi:hypothetical protein
MIRVCYPRDFTCRTCPCVRVAPGRATGEVELEVEAQGQPQSIFLISRHVCPLSIGFSRNMSRGAIRPGRFFTMVIYEETRSPIEYNTTLVTCGRFSTSARGVFAALFWDARTKGVGFT